LRRPHFDVWTPGKKAGTDSGRKSLIGGGIQGEGCARRNALSLVESLSNGQEIA